MLTCLEKIIKLNIQYIQYIWTSVHFSRKIFASSVHANKYSVTVESTAYNEQLI